MGATPVNKKRPRIFTDSERKVTHYLDAETDRQATVFAAGLRSGMRSGSGLRMRKLAPATIKDKVRRGYRSPRAPLYGSGDLIRTIQKRKLASGGRRVAPYGTHVRSGQPARVIFVRHRRGFTLGAARVPARDPFTAQLQRHRRAGSARGLNLVLES